MPLPSVFSDNKSDALFLAIFLSDTAVRSALWKVDEGEIEVIKISKLHSFSQIDDLLVKTDLSLQELGALSEKTDQVLFCLESSWANGGIRDEKKPILKKLSNSLSLKVVGFVVCSEVILDYLKTSKNIASSLLLSVQESSLEVLFVEAGSILAKERVGRSQDIVADLTEALARLENSGNLSKRTYPSKIVLFSTELSDKKLSDEQQKLIKKDWRESHNFLQRPVVELLKVKEASESIIKTGGKVVAEAKGLINTEQASAEEQQPVYINSVSSADKVGKGKNFGFKEIQAQQQGRITAADDNLRPVKEPKSLNLPSFKKKSLNIFSVKTKTKSPSTKGLAQNISHHKLAALGFILGLIFLFFGSIIMLSVNSTVSLRIIPLSQTVSEDVNITLDSSITVSDPEGMLLAAKVAEKTVSGSSTAAATGAKLIGDAASGKVEFINKTDSEKTFDKGTQITAQGQVFLIQEEITIPAAEITSNEDGETKTYGKKEVIVEAKEIGAEGNLAADNTFAVEDFAASSYEAKSLEAFSGGASREIQVVSQQDQEDLLEDLTQELIQAAGEEFKVDSKEGIYFITTGKSDVIKETFSSEVGDEVSTFSLDLELLVEAFSYKTEDLEPLAELTLSSKLPAGFSLVGEAQILSSPGDRESDTDEVVLEANLSSLAQADINKTSLRSEIAGLSFIEAERLLTAKDEIKTVAFSAKPSIAKSLLKKLPKSEKRLTILVSETE